MRLVESLYWLGVRALTGSGSDAAAASATTLGQWDAYELGAGDGAGDSASQDAATATASDARPSLPCAADALEALLVAHGHVDGSGNGSGGRINGSTALCIVPGYSFKVVRDALITNFHQPDSTLLLLVAAFLQGPMGAGATLAPERLGNMYRHAIDGDYGFLSYGDSSVLAAAHFQWGTVPSLLDGSRGGAGAGGSSSTGTGTSTMRDTGVAIPTPVAGDRVLLHSCCAPCSGAMVEAMVGRGLDVTIFFYNPNIHPKEEYEVRKEENKRFAAKLGVPFIDADYDDDVHEWYHRAEGLEWSPERGERCTMCFDMRMERTALHASEHGFAFITTTNATSRWKDEVQVDGSGLRAAARYAGVSYWLEDWKDDEMTRRKYEINADMQFYKQEYCGCAYSLRDVNTFRRSLEGGDLGPIRIPSQAVYHDPAADAEEESLENVNKFFHFDSGDVVSGSEEGRRLQGVYKERRRGIKGSNW